MLRKTHLLGPHGQFPQLAPRPTAPLRPPHPPGSLLPFPHSPRVRAQRPPHPFRVPLTSTPSLFLGAFWGSACCLVNKSRAAGIIYLSNSSQLPISAVSPARPHHVEPTDTLPQAIHFPRPPQVGGDSPLPEDSPPASARCRADLKKKFPRDPMGEGVQPGWAVWEGRGGRGGRGLRTTLGPSSQEGSGGAGILHHYWNISPTLVLPGIRQAEVLGPGGYIGFWGG